MVSPRLVIAAPSSGSGKTTLTIGLMAAFSERMSVQGYKAGPDYIDSGYHTLATGRVSRNLDTWMMPKERVIETFTRNAAELSIIEGVMGLFDGYSGSSEEGSTAEIAKLLDAPVVLMIDVRSMVRSAAALALGFKRFDPDLNLVGVILNRVASDRHSDMVREAIEEIGIKVYGAIPRDEKLRVPERHLGLYMAGEREDVSKEFINYAKNVVSKHIDLPALEKIAHAAPNPHPSLPPKGEGIKFSPPRGEIKEGGGLPRIAIAQDEAFCFYYEDNFDLLRQAGAELIFFSPLHDTSLPKNISGLYLGGGYPELYAEKLSQNNAMRTALKNTIASGLPTYAECGGLMVLTEKFIAEDGIEYPMLGAVPGFTRLTQKLKMGYREVVALENSPLLLKGQKARGHEFHYSEWILPSEKNAFPYEIQSRRNEEARPEGFIKENLLASYVHLHFASNPKLAKNFVTASLAYKTER